MHSRIHSRGKVTDLVLEARAAAAEPSILRDFELARLVVGADPVLPPQSLPVPLAVLRRREVSLAAPQHRSPHGALVSVRAEARVGGPGRRQNGKE